MDNRRQAEEAIAWPWVMGRVIESRVSPARQGKDEDDTFAFWYHYEVAGTWYVGKRIGCFGLEARMPLKAMEAVHARYPEGAAVKVHYDPQDPQRGVLEPENRAGERGGSVIAFASIAFGALVLALGLTRA